MRDPDRLDSFYDALKKIHKERFPDWRFGQLVYNLNRWVECNKKTDTFFFEEDRMLETIEEFAHAFGRQGQ